MERSNYVFINFELRHLREKLNEKVKLGNKYIGESYPTYIIAEAGLNHNGSFEIAKKLIDDKGAYRLSRAILNRYRA